MRHDYADPLYPSERPYALRGSLAILPVEGPLWFGGMGWMADMCGGVAIPAVVSILASLASDANIKGVLIDLHSPGGSAYGMTDIAQAVRALKACGKRVHAIAHDMAASQSYALACLADEIVVTPTACVGSIGITMAGPILDMSESMKRGGVSAFHPASHPNKAIGDPTQPLTDEGRALLQGNIDAQAAVFFEMVASGRSMTVDQVRNLNARTFIGAQAVSAGLADRVSTFAEYLSELSALYAADAQGVAPMSEPTKPVPAPLVTPPPAPPATAPTEPPEVPDPVEGPIASLAQLKDLAGGDSDFVLLAMEQRWSLPQAQAQRIKVLESRLSEAAKKRPAVPGSGGVPVTPQASTPAGPVSFTAAVEGYLHEHPNATEPQAALAMARKHPDLHRAWYQDRVKGPAATFA